MYTWLKERYFHLQETFEIFWDEMRMVFTDSGVIIFFFVVPFLYPLLYSWLYNNESVKDVPAVIVDHSHSKMSEEFIKRYDAAQGAKVVGYANSIQEAKRYMMRQECRGIVYIPRTFEEDIMSNRQTTVSLYADMSGFLYYKGLLISLTDVSLNMGAEIQIHKLGNYTSRDDQLSTAPLLTQDVPMFNPATGYGSYLLPSVLMLIIQQTLLLGIGLSAGTAREKNKYLMLVPVQEKYHNTLRMVFGKGMCYVMLYAIIAAYITMVVPHIFHFLQLATFYNIMIILLPYIIACTFFGMTISCLMRHRENVILYIVFTSVPLLFLTGLVWPGTALSGSWKAIAFLFPSTFGARAYVKLNSMGASFADIYPEFIAMWVQAGFYFLSTCFIYYRQIKKAKKLFREEQLIQDKE